MKRDWVLIRDILKAVEEERFEEYAVEYLKNAEKSTLDSKERDSMKWAFYGHLELLLDKGFVRGVKLVVDDNIGEAYWGVARARLSSSGFDLLDALTTKSIWARVTNYAEQNTIPITFELLKTWLLKTMTMTD